MGEMLRGIDPAGNRSVLAMAAMRAPLLDRDEEHQLAVRWSR